MSFWQWIAVIYGTALVLALFICLVVIVALRRSRIDGEDD